MLIDVPPRDPLVALQPRRPKRRLGHPVVPYGTGDRELPLNRAMTPTPHQQLIREWILCMKEGEVDAAYYRKKFGVDPLKEFAEPLANQARAGYLHVHGDEVKLTRKGVLQVDSLLTEYFEPELRQVRYT